MNKINRINTIKIIKNDKAIIFIIYLNVKFVISSLNYL